MAKQPLAIFLRFPTQRKKPKFLPFMYHFCTFNQLKYTFGQLRLHNKKQKNTFTFVIGIQTHLKLRMVKKITF